MSEILFQPLNGENSPVGIANVTRTVGCLNPTNGGFFERSIRLFQEAGGLGLHTYSVSLHFLYLSLR